MFKYIKSKNKFDQAFYSIFFGAFAVRLLIMGNKTFWLDEAFSWLVAKQDVSKILISTLADNHPPLYYLVLHFWLKLGQTEFLLRLPSLIFGLVSIFLIYQIADKLFSRKTALIASFLFGFSPLQVYFSAETRMYSFWSMLILTTFFCFLKILEKPRSFHFFLFTLLNLLSLYTHYFSIFFLLALDCFIIIKRKTYRKQLKPLLWSQIVSLLFFLPWAVRFILNPHPRPWGVSTIIAIPATFLSYTIGGVGAVTLKTLLGPSTPVIIRLIFLLVSLLLLSLFTIGVFHRGKPEEKNKKLLLLLILFLPMFLVGNISLAKPIYSLRPFIAFSFAFYFLAAQGLEIISKQIKFWPITITLILLILTILIQNFYSPFKPQYLQQAVRLIKENSSAPIIIHNDILTFYPFLYYFGNQAHQYLIYPSELTTKTTNIIGGASVSLYQAIQTSQSFWIVAFVWDEKTWKFNQEDRPKLETKFKLDQNWKVNDLIVQRYKLR